MKIVIIGGGSFGTALANQLSFNPSNNITILVRSRKVEEDINVTQSNSVYFPNRKINHCINASVEPACIKDADVVIIAVPSNSIPSLIENLNLNLSPATLLVNMAKGLFHRGRTIIEYLKYNLKHENLVSLKGASFSAEMIDRDATLLTLGYETRAQFELIKNMALYTNIYLDSTRDVKGVEILSALKNIYAILIGNIDAKFNSANTRFFFLTKAVHEIKTILTFLGGKEDTMFLSCGLGDFCLTSLNDLSRNRTLGLLIGKGFYDGPSFSHNSVVLEGIKTLKLVENTIPSKIMERLPLLRKMISFFVKREKSSLTWEFETLFQSSYRTVLTYGTFDLLHYGHLEILRRAKGLGDKLIVGLSTDEFNKEKGKVCQFPYHKRKSFLESLEFVDLVIPENGWEQKRKDVIENDVQIFVMGNDWKGKFDNLRDICEVVYFPRTKGISTTALKNILQNS